MHEGHTPAKYDGRLLPPRLLPKVWAPGALIALPTISEDHQFSAALHRLQNSEPTSDRNFGGGAAEGCGRPELHRFPNRLLNQLIAFLLLK
jgi:hypothetical protein